jgi:hypothetical protein
MLKTRQYIFKIIKKYFPESGILTLYWVKILPVFFKLSMIWIGLNCEQDIYIHWIYCMRQCTSIWIEIFQKITILWDVPTMSIHWDSPKQNIIVKCQNHQTPKFRMIEIFLKIQIAECLFVIKIDIRISASTIEAFQLQIPIQMNILIGALKKEWKNNS